MKLTLVTLSLALWSVAVSGRADVVAGGGESNSYRRCVEHSDFMDRVRARCELAEFQREDDALDAIYRQLLSRTHGIDRLKLRDEQLNWLTSREQACDGAGLSGSASGGVGAYVNCLRTQTRLRAEQLSVILPMASAP